MKALFKKSKREEKSTKDYFNKAREWADDSACSREVQLSWFKLGFGTSMGLNVILVLAVFSLASIKTLVPLMVHHYENGITTVEPLKDEVLVKNQSQIESDIVRYITNRESYDITSYRAQFDLVTLLSSPQVNSEYLESQNKNNPEAPINKLNIESERSVHVYSVQFLDRKNKNADSVKQDHQELAEVTLKITDKNKATGATEEKHYNVMVSWRYTGMPSSPNERWLNWSGFEVTRYTKQQRNI